LKVFIVNFGRENYLWPRCREDSTVATMNAEAVHQFWVNGDRESYIRYCTEKIDTASGIKSTRPVASRWFNLMTIVAQTVDDVWIHREKEQLWWTVSKTGAATITLEDDLRPLRGAPRIFVCHKPCEPWSNLNKHGNRMDWNSLHAKAKDFLFTEGTLQQLGPDNSAYALALIAGDSLDRWHNQALWKARAQSVRTRPTTVYNARQRAVVRMAMAARDTVAGANGQQVLRTIKNKELRFPSQEALERYIENLIELQEGLCAITRFKLQYDGEHDDSELLCSLDRIDSSGHYEAGNLQIVCRFVNRWKSDDSDSEFRRLIELLQGSADSA
jgi:hypothetical protein